MKWNVRLIAISVSLAAFPISAAAQLAISGSVATETGEPIAGASVMIEGTTVGTVTDENGAYRFVVSAPRPGMSLLVRSISFKPGRRVINETSGAVTQDFRLTRDVLELSQVVITAARGETERSTLGTTIATVDGEEIARSGVPQIDAALAGKVAGALVGTTSGTPGGGTSVRIRGLSTLSRSAEPLYIVDGVIVDNSSTQLIDIGGYSSNRVADLDPNEVERVEVVKGAAAAALYGSRANDGVVQIFTKRGRRGGALRTSFRLTAENSDVAHRIAVNQAPVNEAGQPVVRRDYQDQIFQTAGRLSGTLSMSGGDDKTGFFLSGTMEDQGGVIRGTDYKRQNLRLNLDRTISDKLNVGVNTAYITSKANITPNGGLIFNLGVLTSFLFQPNSHNLFPDPVTGAYPAGFSLANPLDIIANWRAPQTIDRFIGGFRATAYPIAGLTVGYVLGLDRYTQNAQLFIPRASSAPSVPTGVATNVDNRTRLLNSDVDVSYVMNLGSALKLTHGVGVNWQQQQSNIVTAGATNLALLTQVVQGSVMTGTEVRDDRRTLGFYGQEQVAIAEKLFLTASLRSDASSAFGAEERRQWFPKIGAALNLSDYGFWAPMSRFAPTVRLRGGFGYSGGQPTGSFDRLSNYVFEPSGTRSGIVNSTQQGNQNLKPERAREIEFGTDAEFIGGRLGLGLTFFDKRVTDLILPKTVDPSSGFISQLANVGELENKGIEVLLRSFNVQRSNFTWNSTVTYATNRPKVTKVSDGGAFFIPESFNIIRVEAGQAPGHFFGTTYVRDAEGRILTAAGVPIQDASGAITGIPAIGTRRIIGDPNPDAYWSFINEIGIGKPLSFRVQLDGVQGGDIFNFDRRLLETPAFGSGAAYGAELLGQVPRGYFLARRGIFEEYIEDGSWVKLREVSLTYSLGSRFASLLRSQGADISLIGRNLHTWTKYTGWDPETNAGAQRTLVRGFSFATTPIPRSFGVTITANY